MMKEGNCIVNHEETNILFVEDDATICKSLPPILETYGYKVKNVNTYMQAIQTIKADNFDLYLIDIHIPGGDGFELCRMIRKQENTPVIFLTGVNDEASIVFGLGLGADDYITKPFSVLELISRIKAVLRRSERDEIRAQDYHGIVIDLLSRKVTIDGQEVQLTYKEFELLSCLTEKQGQVINREFLLRKIWGFDFEGETRTLDVHIGSLRHKLGDKSKYIETVRNVGYKFV